MKLGRNVNHGERMNPIDFRGRRSKVKVTMDTYVNKLMNTIETKSSCASLSNLAEKLKRMNPIDFGGHRSRSQWISFDECGVRGDATLCIVW